MTEIINETVLIFGDIETGGLNGVLENKELGMQYYPIFEIAIIVTDTDLNAIGEPLRVVIHQDEGEIEKSHKWAIEKHTESGLLKEVRESGISLKIAEILILDYLLELGVAKYDRKSKVGGIFAGNSIMFDRSFLLCQMPKFHDYMHYRQIDISSLALLARMWNPQFEQEAVSVKEYSHEALADIRESIAELKVYKQGLFPVHTVC